MSNLTATILSIALAAIVAGLSIVVLSPAIATYTNQIYVNEMMDLGKQLNGAGQAYIANNG